MICQAVPYQTMYRHCNRKVPELDSILRWQTLLRRFVKSIKKKYDSPVNQALSLQVIGKVNVHSLTATCRGSFSVSSPLHPDHNEATLPLHQDSPLVLRKNELN